MLATMLRALARAGQYGHVRTPASFYMGEDYCTFYWSGARSAGIADHATWIRVLKLSDRYRRFVRYCRETLPQWTDVETINYADNSIVVVQRSAAGATREVMVKAPSGDACF